MFLFLPLNSVFSVYLVKCPLMTVTVHSRGRALRAPSSAVASNGEGRSLSGSLGKPEACVGNVVTKRPNFYSMKLKRRVLSQRKRTASPLNAI